MSLAAMVSGTKRFASTATVPTSPSLTRVAANHRPSYVDPDLWPCFFLQQQNTAKQVFFNLLSNIQTPEMESLFSQAAKVLPCSLLPTPNGNRIFLIPLILLFPF
ncbi:uncharacterized protein LOC131153371 isoform X1 [Malania oleifera]|uniref:uncharacterized protein LOC131153371 isoform X1 n=1 Tax=Malania oleifera TaxID=397392 RepID=UPI0025ADA856|nr:uncharacterized protein LOC131153371 isoform X1 [Malania oleifera]